MDDKNFDKLIKNEMHQKRDFEYQESLWNALDNKLRNGAVPGTNYWRWISLLLFLLLILTFFNPWKSNDLGSSAQELTTTLETPSNKSIVLNDTVYNNVTITTYDTIIRTKYVTKTINSSSNDKIMRYASNTISDFKLENNRSRDYLVFEQLRKSQKWQAASTKSKLDHLEEMASDETETNSIDNTIVENDTLDITEDLANINVPMSSPDQQEKEALEKASFEKIYNQVNKEKSKKEKFYDGIKNGIKYNGFGLGIAGGLKNTILGDTHSSFEPTIGGMGELRLGNHIRIKDEFNYSIAQFMFDDFDPGAGIPIITPPISNYKVNQIEVNRNITLNQLEARLDVLSSTKWSLLTGGGYVLGYLSSNIIDYAFQLNGEGEEIHVINEIENTDKYIHGAYGNIGLEYRIFKDLSINSNLNYFLNSSVLKTYPVPKWSSNISIVYNINQN